MIPMVLARANCIRDRLLGSVVSWAGTTFFRPLPSTKYLKPFSEIPIKISIGLSELHLFVVVLRIITCDSINAV